MSGDAANLSANDSTVWVKLAAARKSLSARILLTALVATIVFALCFGLVSRVWVMRLLQDDLEARAAALGHGVLVGAAEASALGDVVALHSLLRETARSHPDIHYIAVLDHEGNLLGHSLGRPLSAVFVARIARPRPPNRALVLRTELGQVRDVAVRETPERGVVVHVGIGERTLEELLQLMNLLLSLAGGVALAAGLLGAYLVSRRLVSPLTAIAAATVQVAEFARAQDPVGTSAFAPALQLPSATGIREIDQLSTSFAQMNDALMTGRGRLLQAQKLAARTERMAALGAFVAGTAHAVNNPLAGVRACLEMVETSTGDVGRLKRYVALAQEGLGRIQLLTSRLVRFVPRESGEVATFDAHAVLRQSLATSGLLRHDGNPGTAVKFELAATQHLLTADPDEFEQAVTNLVINAAQATPPDGGVALRTSDDGPGWLRLDVDDDGPGVPEALRAKIFEPFFTTKPEGKGTGLGLWLVWAFVERCGGRVEAGAAPGGGARFSLWLPAREQGEPVRVGGDDD